MSSGATVRELVTKLRFVYENSGLSQFQQKVKSAKTTMGQFAQNVRSNGRGMFAGMNAGLDGVRAKVRGLTAEWQKQKIVLSRAKNIARIRAERLKTENGKGDDLGSGLMSVKNLAVGYIGAIAGGSVMQIADSWASVSGRIKLATKDAEEHKYAMEEIYNISQRTGQAMEATGDLFQKVARNQKDLGLQTKDTLKLTEIIGQTLAIGGGDETANSAGLLQLGQALAAGKLSGDELNSIIEQTPRLAEAIASSFGIGVGQLKEMGKQGKLTAKELAQGLLKQADKIQKEFDEMPKTFSTSMTKLKNAFGRFISFAVNDVLQLGNVFARVASWIEENIKLVLILAASAIGGKLMIALRSAQGGVKALGSAIWKAMAPMLPWIALFAAIGLLIEDLYVWTQGGDTLAGRLFGDFEGWKQQFSDIGKSAKMLWLNIKGLFNQILALTGSDFRIDFNSWREGASAALQYVIDSVKRMLNFFRSIVRSIRRLISGDFNGAFLEAGNVIDNFSLIGSAALLWFAKTVIGAIHSIARAMLAAMSANPILTAISLIIAALVAIVIYWDEIEAVAIATWEIIETKASEMWDNVKSYADEKWKALTDGITSLWTNVTSTFGNLWGSVVKKVTGLLESMIPKGVKDFFGEIADFFGSDSDKNINVNVNGNLAALQQPTGSRSYSNMQTNNIVVNAANNPNSVANSVKNAATSLGRNGSFMKGIEQAG
ncbi:putative tail protein [Actinobacillus lignieresii]|uniref:tape measure protein n=1 Tax=Actinobacillus lignieresii TaxID=720 RepID=UPI000F6FDBF2|nr:tape measure protein [Actinobacillus lignieresii]VEB26152.1 putative tail protein [Actinobacillus lignieresii]